MSFKFTFREITPEDTEILRMLKLRNAKPEKHVCCEILRGDGITMKTWYSKADVALWGEAVSYTHLDVYKRQDRGSAIKWFQLAADQGNEYAQYFLEHMNDRLGQPPVAAIVSLLHHLANIFQEQNQPPPSGGIRVAVDRKLLRKIRAKQIAQGHKADDHEPEMQL